MAANLNLVVMYGDAFDVTLVFEDEDGAPISFLGQSLRAQVRERMDDEDAKLDMTDGNGGITVGGAGNNELSFFASSALMATEEMEPKQYVWSFTAINAGNQRTWLEGIFEVQNNATR